MTERLVISVSDIERYTQELDDLIPEKINGIDVLYETMVNIHYIPRSVILQRLEATRDPLTPFISAWNYEAYRMATDQCGFAPMQRLKGFVVLQIGPDGSLITDEVDFLAGLLSTAESDYQFDETAG